MLLQIQKELIRNTTFKFATLVEQDFEKYLKLKQEYEKLPALAKQKLSNQLKVFLLLNAYNRDDLSFIADLINAHNYDKFEHSAVKETLGRFYAKLGYFQKKTVEYLFPLFQANQLNKDDIGLLFLALSQMGMHNRCEQVLSFVLTNYPDDLDWKIEALKYQIKMVLVKEKKDADNDVITGNLKYLLNRCETSKQYAFLAPSFYQMGLFDDFFNTFNFAFEIVKPDIIECVKSEISFFSALVCRNVMDEIIDILDSHEIKAFPIGGSLLGLFRDGKFMDYDKDADIGIFVNDYEEVFKIVSILCKIPKFIAPTMVNTSKESCKWNVAIFDTEQDIGADLFFFYHEQEQVVEGIYTSQGILKWGFKPFKLVQQELAGKVYWVPENIDLFLTELYDNWREPVEVWDSLVDCPNVLSSSKPVVIYYGLIRLWDALNKNKTVKALNYYQKLTTKWGMKFSDKANANIKKLLNLAD